MDPLLYFLQNFTAEKAEPSYLTEIQSDEERVVAKVKSLLNSLTRWNFEKVKDQLVQTIREALSVSLLQFVVTCIFNMAIADDGFVLFGHLCSVLSCQLPRIPSEDFLERDITFKRLMLNKCQMEFEEAVSMETDRSLMAYDEEELRVRLVGTVRFAAELFSCRMLTENICHHIIQTLLRPPCPSERNIQAIFEFMSSIGKRVNTSPSSRRYFDKYVDKLEEVLQNPRLTRNSRDMIFELQNLRANNWVSTGSSTSSPPGAASNQELPYCAAATTGNGLSDKYDANGLRPDSSEEGGHLLATVALERVDDDVHEKLQKALKEIRALKLEVCREHLCRVNAEKEATEAVHVAKGLEIKYQEEARLRKETEDTLERERGEVKKMKILLENCRKERDNALKITEDLLENQAEEMSSLWFSRSDEHQTPSSFFCPISQEVMKDPHVAADGFTYEAEAIRKWVESGHNTSPMTNLELPHRALVPNHALRSAIREWQQPKLNTPKEEGRSIV